jgi:hypothetical protein
VERLRMAGRGCIGMVVVMALEGEREREREREWRGGREGEGRINSSTFFFIQSSLAPLEYKPCLNRLMTKSHWLNYQKYSRAIPIELPKITQLTLENKNIKLVGLK